MSDRPPEERSFYHPVLHPRSSTKHVTFGPSESVHGHGHGHSHGQGHKHRHHHREHHHRHQQQPTELGMDGEERGMEEGAMAPCSPRTDELDSMMQTTHLLTPYDDGTDQTPEEPMSPEVEERESSDDEEEHDHTATPKFPAASTTTTSQATAAYFASPVLPPDSPGKVDSPQDQEERQQLPLGETSGVMNSPTWTLDSPIASPRMWPGRQKAPATPKMPISKTLRTLAATNAAQPHARQPLSPVMAAQHHNHHHHHQKGRRTTSVWGSLLSTLGIKKSAAYHQTTAATKDTTTADGDVTAAEAATTEDKDSKWYFQQEDQAGDGDGGDDKNGGDGTDGHSPKAEVREMMVLGSRRLERAPKNDYFGTRAAKTGSSSGSSSSSSSDSSDESSGSKNGRSRGDRSKGHARRGSNKEQSGDDDEIVDVTSDEDGAELGPLDMDDNEGERLPRTSIDVTRSRARALGYGGSSGSSQSDSSSDSGTDRAGDSTVDVPDEYGAMTREQFFEIIDFVLALTESLHKYGMPTHRLEYQVTWVAQRFGISAVSMVFPSSITVTFRRTAEPHTSFAYTINAEYSWNLEKLQLADRLAMKVASHRLTLDEGIAELQAIRDAPTRYPWWVQLLVMTLVSGFACSFFFGGGLYESVVATVCGFISGILLVLAGKAVAFARLFEPLSAILCSFVATLANNLRWLGPLETRSVIMSGIIWGLPGLQINTAISDLAAHMMVCGTARLMFAVLIIFELAFGMVIGTQIARAAAPLSTPAAAAAVAAASVFSSDSSSSSASSLLSSAAEVVVPTFPISKWWTIILLPLTCSIFGMLLGAKFTQFPAMIVAGAVAWLQTLLTDALGTEVSTMIAQTCVVLVGNIYARVFDKVATIPTCIGSLMLMPSSVGVRGISQILEGSADDGTSFAFIMRITAVSMAVGGYLANMVMFPKRAF